MYNLAVFKGGRPLCTQILPGQGRPPLTILGIRKTRDTGLPNGEDCIPLHSLVLTQYRSVMDGQTDMTEMRPVAYTALAMRALQHAIKTGMLAVPI